MQASRGDRSDDVGHVADAAALNEQIRALTSGPEFVKAMGELAPNMKVVVVNAENSGQTQISQAETAISQGAKALVAKAGLQPLTHPLRRVLLHQHASLEGQPRWHRPGDVRTHRAAASRRLLAAPAHLDRLVVHEEYSRPEVRL